MADKSDESSEPDTWASREDFRTDDVAEETSAYEFSSLLDAETAISNASGSSSETATEASPESRDPLGIAAEQGWLSDTMAADLLATADGDALAAFRSAFDSGKLSAREYDIVAALAGIREVAPGFRVQSLLGRGGMGAVYLAEQENLGRPVALKTILVDAESTDEAVTRFKQEARTIAKLRHPNIITAYDFGDHAGRLYLAMELVEGEDLDTRLKGGPIPDLQALAIARQIAAALLAAGKLGVVHRDIKPANVLLVPPPEGSPLPAGVPLVKVADFGLAFLADTTASDRVTSANVAVGSPHYMAPELLRGADATPSSDLYAVGATLFRMLSTEPPFAGKPLSVLINDKLSGKVPIATGASPELQGLIAAMMATEPEDRPESFEELISRIDALIGSEMPLGHASDRTFVSTQRLSSKRGRKDAVQWKTVVLGAAAVLASAAVVATFAPSRTPDPAPMAAPPEVETVGGFETLFRGVTFGDWKPLAGGLNPGMSEAEGQSALQVLAGKGTVQRIIPASFVQGFYRFSFFAYRSEDARTICTFNVPPGGANEAGERYELVIESNSIEIRSATAFDESANRRLIESFERTPELIKRVSKSEDASAPLRFDQVHVVIDFRPSDRNGNLAWFVTVDDVAENVKLPAIPGDDGLVLNQILTLASEDSRSEFFEITIQKLEVVPEATPAGFQ